VKNVTLSMDEELLKAARAYAARHQTTLNQMVRDMLQGKVGSEPAAAIEELKHLWEAYPGDSRGWTWNRKDLYGDRW
jgi:hypothetical protein